MPSLGKGVTITKKGYVRITAGVNRGKYEHRLVISQLDKEGPCHLFRSLDEGVEIHHIDWKRSHNCPHNLLVLDTVIHDAFASEHARKVRWGSVQKASNG